MTYNTKTFYKLLINNTIATITNFTVWFALVFFVYLETKSVFATSVISGIFLVATAVSGFWLGSIVDHNKKKDVMLYSSIFSLVIYILAFAIYITADPEVFKKTSSLTLWIFVPLSLFGVIAGNLRNIALPTLVAMLIPEEKRDKANGILGTAGGVSFLIVSVISGLLVGQGGMYYVLILAIIMSVLAIFHLFTVNFEETITPTETEENKEAVYSVEDRKGDIKHSKHSKKIDIRGTIAAISAVPGLLALILFTTFNNFLGGVFMSLMDAYGLSLVTVEIWGILWGVLSTAFIIGGLIIAKWGLGKNPLKALFLTNITIWIISSVFTLRSSIVLLTIGMFIYLCIVPFIEASEHTIIQKVVPKERLGRVFGFAQSVEQAASPLTAFLIGPLTEFVFIPFMTTGKGVDLIGGWFGTGSERGIALVFTVTGIIGLCATLIAMNSKYYKLLSRRYIEE